MRPRKHGAHRPTLPPIRRRKNEHLHRTTRPLFHQLYRKRPRLRPRTHRRQSHATLLLHRNLRLRPRRIRPRRLRSRPPNHRSAHPTTPRPHAPKHQLPASAHRTSAQPHRHDSTRNRMRRPRRQRLRSLTHHPPTNRRLQRHQIRQSKPRHHARSLHTRHTTKNRTRHPTPQRSHATQPTRRRSMAIPRKFLHRTIQVH